jgi:antimicrobial peptide system SdpA family protein
MKSILTLIFSVLIVVIISLYVISISFGNNPLNTSVLSRAKLTSILPEGWAFFTKSATDPNTFIYNLIDNKAVEIKLKNSLPKYYFGISRINRLYNIELNNIFSKALKDSVIEYKYKSINKNLLLSTINTDTLKYTTVNIKKSLVPDFENGFYLYIVQLMLPWSILHENSNFKSKFIVYKIKLNTYE